MNDQIPTPDNTPPMQELSETLRRAVEQVRRIAPPIEAIERATNRAQQLGPPPRRRSRRWLAYSAAAGIAAAILVGFWLWPDRAEKSSEQVALNQRAMGEPNLPAREPAPQAVIPTDELRIKGSGNNHTSPRAAGDASGDAENFQWSEKAEWSGRASRPGQPNVPQGQANGPPVDVRAKTRILAQTSPESPTLSRTSGGTLPARLGQKVDSGAGSGQGHGIDNMGISGVAGPTAHYLNHRPDGDMSGMAGGMPTSGGRKPNSDKDLKDLKQQHLKDLKLQLDRYKELASETRRLREEVSRAVADPKVLAAAESDLQAAGKLLKETREKIGGQQQLSREKGPQVWHRDRGQPTFARVYLGDGNSLELVSLHVSVTVEGPRARTVVDHIFRNPHNRQLEGTFEYPLPTGASPSYFAMFLGQTRNTVPALFANRGENAPLPAAALAQMTPAELVKHVDTADWGQLQEGRIVSKEKALETYEEVVRGRIDPALLEYAGGNTFSGRVFPIPPQGYNRVILAYEELLPFAQEQMIYRFPLPGRKLNDMQLRLQAKTADCLQPAFLPKDATKEEHGGRITFTRTWKDSKPEGDAVFACTPAHTDVQAVSGRQGDNGPRYVYARLRPTLKTVANGKPFASHAVFLLDTSLSEHPDRFAVNMKLLQKILETDTDIKQFNILTFNVGAAWLDPKGCFDNTAAGREKALKKLDGIVLEGATDISCALNELAAPGSLVPLGMPLSEFAPTPLNVFLLSDGHITWGEPDVAALVAGFEQHCRYLTRFHCYRTGLGEENSELFEALTRRGGGVFQCYGEAELQAAAKAHRSQCLRIQRVRFVGGPQASDVVVSGRRAAVYPGGELVVAARFNGTGRTTALVEGEFAGQKVVQEFPLEVHSDSELAPRAWAEIAVSSLLALHDSNFDALVTAYCQQFGIVSRVASFLVLENEADYKRFNLEEERGKTIAGDLGNFLSEKWSQLGKRVPAAKAFERFLKQVDKSVNLLNGPESAHVKRMLAALTGEDFELPSSSVRGNLVYPKDVAGYLEERERDRRNVGVYLKEARRRAESDDVDGAVRVLSSIIEEYPSRGDALRLVGYRLLDLQQPAQAARLFSQVQKQRPFEPHSYRDLAHALEHSGQYGLAALNYEIVLAGAWHNRFRQELKLVAQEEYAHMMQEAIRSHRVGSKLVDLFGERLEQMARPQPKSDLRVTISWNTDATDVDLWVIEPDGTKCFYQHNRTQSGGELSQDQTQGYGPERYQIAKAQPGVYTVLVHYFAVNPNLLGGETHVSLTVTRFAGTPQEQTERHTVILKQHNQQVEVCKVKF
jgi:tetratricopeptide (TPR) repeat protein